jgi:hypothetical protein
MNQRLKSKQSGLKHEMVELGRKFYEPDSCKLDLSYLNKTITGAMKALNYDRVMTDEVGNIIGVVGGYTKKEEVVLLCNIDLSSVSRRGNEHEDAGNYRMGIIASILAGALLKRSQAAMNGDLTVACVHRMNASDFGIRYLFENYLRGRNIKGVILAEPTDFHVCIGNKGKLEYEITVTGDLDSTSVRAPGYNMMSAVFPLIHELEEAAKRLPLNHDLGSSCLSIKDVSIGVSAANSSKKELRVLVDRLYIPEESSQSIVARAQTIAQGVFRDKPAANVSTVLTKERVVTASGKELELKNQYEPWKMESHNPFVLGSLEVLRENGIDAGVRFWKKIITDGSYTFGSLGIPTIGYGAGTEGEDLVLNRNVLYEDIEKSYLGKAMIAYRAIGFPTFGWNDDEI